MVQTRARNTTKIGAGRGGDARGRQTGDSSDGRMSDMAESNANHGSGDEVTRDGRIDIDNPEDDDDGQVSDNRPKRKRKRRRAPRSSLADNEGSDDSEFQPNEEPEVRPQTDATTVNHDSITAFLKGTGELPRAQLPRSAMYIAAHVARMGEKNQVWREASTEISLHKTRITAIDVSSRNLSAENRARMDRVLADLDAFKLPAS